MAVTKKKLRKRIRKLEEELRKTGHEAYYAEEVCRAVGEVLDPANKFVREDREARLINLYTQWKKEVPQPPFRGIHFDLCSRISAGPLRFEWQDEQGYWH